MQSQEPLKDQIICLKKLTNSSSLSKIKCMDKCMDIFAIIFNLITWILIILAIVFYKISEDHDYLITFLSPGAICYLIYLFLECCSISNIYLKEKDDKMIKEKIEDIFKKNLFICFYIQCYHISPRANHGVDEEVITHSDAIKFDYNYCRDISGIFELNINESNYKYKYYVILKVIYEVIFIDDTTLDEYNKLKEDFLRLNKNKDCKYRLYEFYDEDSFHNKHLIKIHEKEPLFVSYFWFTIFTLLSLSTLYKIYLCIISIEQTLVIKKIISNRNNLLNDAIYNR